MRTAALLTLSIWLAGSLLFAGCGADDEDKGEDESAGGDADTDTDTDTDTDADADADADTDTDNGDDTAVVYEANCPDVCAKANAADCYEAGEDPETQTPPTTQDCINDCEVDLYDCPEEMQALLDCHAATEMVCDPEEDQGIGHGECEAEHAGVQECGHDPF
jgi:hypothetical protein